MKSLLFPLRGATRDLRVRRARSPVRNTKCLCHAGRNERAASGFSNDRDETTSTCSGDPDAHAVRSPDRGAPARLTSARNQRRTEGRARVKRCGVPGREGSRCSKSTNREPLSGSYSVSASSGGTRPKISNTSGASTSFRLVVKCFPVRLYRARNGTARRS